MDDPLRGKTLQSESPVNEATPTPTPVSVQAPLAPEPQNSTPISPLTPPSEEFSPTAPSSQSSPPRFSIANIIKLLIGLVAVSIIGFMVFGIILPSLNKKVEKVELTLWDISDGSTIGNVLPDFEKQNPNIKINLIKQDIKDYKDRLTTRVRNGTGPDLFRFHNTWVVQLSDILLPISSDVITKDIFAKTYYPVARHDLVKNGAVYGIPLEIDTLSLFVNSAMLKAANVTAPTNWNDFITTARSLTLKDQNGKIKTAGAGIGTFDNVTHAPDIVSVLFSQDGVNLDDISQTKDRVTDALNFYTAFALSDGSVWEGTLDPSILAFSKGNLAMYFGYYKDLPTIKSANPSLTFDIASVPHLTGQNQTIASYYPIGASIKSKHQKEALLFLKYLTQRDVAQKLTTLPFARSDLEDKTKGQAKDAVSSYFSGETFDNGLNSQVNTHLSTAINSILSGATADSVVDNLILGFSQVFNQFKPTQ